jgi:hypothetical protein
MGGIGRAREIVADGWRLRGDPSSELATFSADTRMPKPGGLPIASAVRRYDRQALHLEAFAKGTDDSSCSKPSDPPLPDVAVLIRMDGLLRARWQIARFFRDRHQCPLVAIIGNEGKTHDFRMPVTTRMTPSAMGGGHVREMRDGAEGRWAPTWHSRRLHGAREGPRSMVSPTQKKEGGGSGHPEKETFGVLRLGAHEDRSRGGS